jgi:hypothetical protein
MQPPTAPVAPTSGVPSPLMSPDPTEPHSIAPADLDLDTAGWFRLLLATPDENSLAGFDLDVGTLDGRLARRYTARYGPLTPSAEFQGALPVAIGPYGDLVLVAFWDGEGSDLRTISVTSGQDELLLRRNDIIHALGFDATTETVYALTLDPETRRESSIIRFPRDRPDGHESIAMAEAGPGLTEQIWTRLWVTPDGTRLVVIDCPDHCTSRVLQLGAVPPVSPFALGNGDVVGVTNDEIVTVFDCAPPCPATRYDFASGDAGPIAVFCGAGVLVSVQGRPALISEWPTPRAGCQDDAYRVGRTDLASSEQTMIAQPPDRAREIVPFDFSQSAAPPAGWFLLGPKGRLVGTGDDRLVPPVLVRAEDGSEVELRPLGPPRDP